MDKTKKEYKVTYKTYYNYRLKKNHFHKKLMHPLYVQITFDRIPIIFKSYYYDLFAKPKYAIRIGGQIFTPDIKVVISKEKKLIEFIIDKNLHDFSLAIFKEQYTLYSRDLLDIMEKPFLDYLYTFFHDEGLPFLAETIKKGALDNNLFDLVRDLKKALTPAIYQKLIENSFYFAPPYLPLFAFIEKTKRNHFRCLTVMEWEDAQTKEEFIKFFNNYYPSNDIAQTLHAIQKWIFK